MSVGNTSNYPSGNTYTGSNGKTAGGADLSALTEAFQNAFRTSLIGTDSNQKTDSLLKTTDTAESSTRLEQNRNDQRQIEAARQDGSRESRQSQNQADVRQNEMDREYRDVNDRRELTQNADDHRTQRNEMFADSEAKIKSPGREFGGESERLSGDCAAIHPRLFEPGLFEQSGISVAANAMPGNSTMTVNLANTATNPATPISTASVPVTEMVSAAMINVTGIATLPVSQSVMQSTATPLSVSLQASTSVLTVFTASGRLGEDKKKEEEERRGDWVGKSAEKKKEKKGTAFFGEAVIRAMGSGDRVSVRKKSDMTEPDGLSRFVSIEQAEKEEKETKTTAEESGADRDRQDPTFAELLRRMQAVNEPEPMAVRETNASEPSPQEERILFIQRVVAACYSATQRNDVVRIKLSLNENESLTLRMSTRRTSEGKRELSVRFEAESEATAELLRNHLDELQNTLADRGVVLCQVEIET